MRLIFAFLVFVTLWKCSFASLIVKDYYDPKEQLEEVRIENFVLLVKEGIPHALIHKNGSTVDDESTIALVLEQYAETRLPSQSTLREWKDTMYQFDKSRERATRVCKHNTGLDLGLSCNREDLCQACRAIPLCKDLQGAHGFVDVVVEYARVQQRFDDELRDFFNDIETTEQNATPQRIRAIAERVERIATLKATLEANKLFQCDDCFQFCPSIPFNETALQKVIVETHLAALRMQPFENVGALVSRIQNENHKRKSDAEKRARMRYLWAEYHKAREQRNVFFSMFHSVENVAIVKPYHASLRNDMNYYLSRAEEALEKSDAEQAEEALRNFFALRNGAYAQEIEEAFATIKRMQEKYAQLSSRAQEEQEPHLTRALENITIRYFSQKIPIDMLSEGERALELREKENGAQGQVPPPNQSIDALIAMMLIVLVIVGIIALYFAMRNTRR